MFETMAGNRGQFSTCAPLCVCKETHKPPEIAAGSFMVYTPFAGTAEYWKREREPRPSCELAPLRRIVSRGENPELALILYFCSRDQKQQRKRSRSLLRFDHVITRV
jgi:hypothetical protein